MVHTLEQDENNWKYCACTLIFHHCVHLPFLQRITTVPVKCTAANETENLLSVFPWQPLTSSSPWIGPLVFSIVPWLISSVKVLQGGHEQIWHASRCSALKLTHTLTLIHTHMHARTTKLTINQSCHVSAVYSVRHHITGREELYIRDELQTGNHGRIFLHLHDTHSSHLTVSSN